MGDLIPLHHLFHIEYGNQLDLNKQRKLDDGVNFVSRSEKNLGVACRIREIPNIPPHSSNKITVALGGSVLSSFVQPEPFYTGQNVKVLTSLTDMSWEQLVYYCVAIKQNAYRYSAFGREANRTLDHLLVPSITSIDEELIKQNVVKPQIEPEKRLNLGLSNHPWAAFKLTNLFDIKKGRRLTKAKMREGATPFVASIDSNNGVRQKISANAEHPGNTITVNYNGSVGEAFYQAEPFYASDDVNVLYPKFEMNIFIGLFIASIIRREKYRFSYGRKWNIQRMKKSELFLPVTDCRNPDWGFMESFILSMPFSRHLKKRHN